MKKQYDVLKIVCDTYQKSISEYMQEALVELMRSDIEEGNFCDALLDKLDGDDPNEEKRMDSSSSAPIKDDIDSLQFKKIFLPNGLIFDNGDWILFLSLNIFRTGLLSTFSWNFISDTLFLAFI